MNENFVSTRRSKGVTLNAAPVTNEVIRADSYARMSDEVRARVHVVAIVPPQLGGAGFGSLLIEHKSPIYKVFK